MSTEFPNIYSTEGFISYRKYILQITQPSQYRCTQLQYRFAEISETPSISPAVNVKGSIILLQQKIALAQ